jgi:hypothetical protein
MIYKVILFLNLIAMAMVIYLLASYAKNKFNKNKDQQKNQDDAMQ